MKKTTNPPKFWRGNTTVFPMKNADFPMKNGDEELPGVTNRRDRSLPPAAERLEAPPTARGPRIEISDYL